MSTKSKAENMRLFNEAKTLKESMRSSLHQKATNASFCEYTPAQSKVYNNANPAGSKKRRS